MSDFPDALRGIITVLNTPFTPYDHIDADGVHRHVSYALRAGVAGVLVPAMAGEVSFLQDTEREFLVASVLEAVADAVPVIGGASAATPERRLHWTQRMIELGCDGVLVSIPYESDAVYADEVRRLADLHPGFLMLQDWCSDGYGLPLALIVHLFNEIPCFTCLKIETACAGPKYSEVLKATSGRLHVSGGWAVTQMPDGLERGVHAFMPTALHYTYQRIYALHRQGNREAALALFNRVRPILDYSNQNLACSIHFFKALLHAQGMYATARVRQPLEAPIDESVCAVMLARAQALESELSGGAV